MKFLNDEQAAIFQSLVEANTDPYGKRIVSFAKDWAEGMEQRMAAGATIPDCAGAVARVADYDGITGFMYGAAAKIVSQMWEHGEAFRQWYNRDTAFSKEEGEKANATPGATINPALITIGK